MEGISLFWFRRDLRIEDNAGLYAALKGKNPVLPIFIFDTFILDKLEDKADERVSFIYQKTLQLNSQLQKYGSALLVKYGSPLQVFKSVTEEYNVKAVFTNHDYEPYAKDRDLAVAEFLNDRGVKFLTFKDQCIFEKHEVVKKTGEPYTIFTPYANTWKALLNDFYLKSYPSEKYLINLHKMNPVPVLPLDDIGFIASEKDFPECNINEELISNYTEKRNFPALNGVSRLGIHLRFGTISIRTLARKAMELNNTFLSELIWRDFYMQILWHFPQVENGAFKAAFNQIEWRNNEEEFAAWCNGTTGYPLVDAGMRQLNATGFMHNRVRMVAASFLAKHLLIDWRWGEAYFGKKLLDYDLSANNGGWQWAAGTGTDAQPYFRIFNPEAQMKKFDPQSVYVKKWVPEFGTNEYSAPIVDHVFARERCLRVYKQALGRYISD